MFRGVWNNISVALKSANPGENDEEFLREVNLMADLRHPNILPLFGLYGHHNQIMIVTEYMNNGDLLSLLHNEAEIEDEDLVSFCKQVSIGMQYSMTKIFCTEI